MRVRTGIERVLEDGAGVRPGDRVALVANQASVTPDLRHVAPRLAARDGVRVVRILAPEHGLWGDAQDMIAVDDEVDPGTGLPVASLYGGDEQSLRPGAHLLADVDVVLFDLQDVGARYYTFLATLSYLMEAAGPLGVRVVVADRPNPIGGTVIEGPPTVAGPMRSFVGAFAVPVRHGMTPGEIARLLQGRDGLACELEVVALEGWTRDRWYDRTGLPWVAPSPNMPTLDTATVYPGQCLLEGTNLSEGRGSTRPFEVCGAPWVDPFALARSLEEVGLPGLRPRPLYFRPTFQKWAGARCGGVQLHVEDRDAFRSVSATLALLAAVREQDPERFDWRREVYEFVGDRLAFDLLCGSGDVRGALEAGVAGQEIVDGWAGALAEFAEVRRPYLLYDPS